MNALKALGRLAGQVVGIALGILAYRFVAAHSDGWGTAAFVLVCIACVAALGVSDKPRSKR